MIGGMSRQTRMALVGLIAVALALMAYDATAPWRAGTPASGPSTPVLEAPRPELQRGLDKTPLVYPAQFVDALVTRLRAGLVTARPDAPAEPTAGIVVSPTEVVVAAGQPFDKWTLTTGNDVTFPARLVAVDPVRGLSLLRPVEPLPDFAVTVPFGPPALVSGSPVLALLATPAAIVTQLLPAPGTEASLGARLRSGQLPAGTAVVDLDGRLVAFLGAGIRGGLPFTSEDLQNEVLVALRGGVSVAVPWIGMDLQNLDGALADRFPEGDMVVVYVEPGSPADEAGLRVNDVLTRARVGNVAVTTAEEVDERIQTGVVFEAEVVRRAGRAVRTSAVKLTVGRRSYPAGVDGSTGVNIVDGGVVVEVAPASPAAGAGLRTGDRVELVDGLAATRTRVEAALRREDSHLLRVLRDGHRRYVLLPGREAS